MAGNKTLELSIKIAGKVDRSLINAINAAQSNVSSLSTTLSKMGTVGLAAMGTLATGTVAALAKCTDAAKNFESQMGDVVKYVDGLADADGLISNQLASNGATYAENYAAMSDAILDLSTQIPMTAEELTQLAAAAGQSGKGIGDLIQTDAAGNIGGFLKDVAMMGTAMDISADQAGDWAAKWEQAFKMDHSEVMVLADQINYLGANSATTAAEIAAAVNSAASLGQIGGISVSTTAALADAMLATGVASDQVGTSIKRMVTNFSKGSAATKQQKELWKDLGFTAEGVAKSMQKDSVKMLDSIFKAVKGLPEERQVAALSTLFGQWAIEGGAKIVNNMDVYEKALAMVNDPSKYTGSMEREFIIKASTSEAIDSMRANAFQATKIDEGTAFLPAKKEISVALIDFMNQLRSMPELGEIAQQLATLFSRGVSWAAGALEDALPTIQKALDYLVNNGPQVTRILEGLAGTFAAMKFAPGIEVLLHGAGGLSKTGGSAHAGGGGIAGLVGSLFKGGQNVTGKVTSGMGQYFGGILSSVKNVGTVFSAESAARAAEPITLLNSGIGAKASSMWGSFGNIAKAGTGVLSSIFKPMAPMASSIAKSGPGQYVKSILSSVVNPASASAPITLANATPAAKIVGGLGNVGGMMKAVWGPIASGFGGLLSGALPIIGVISSIIAVVSLLNDKFGIVEGVFNRLFGEEGPEKLENFKGFMDNLFNGDGVLQAWNGLREKIFGTLDDGGYSGGFLSNVLSTETIDSLIGALNAAMPIVQSVMGVIGQVVTFANTTVKPIIQEIFGFITQTVVPILLQTFTAAAPVISGIISNLGSAVMTCMQVIGSAIQAALPIVEGIISVVLSIASVVIPALLAGYEAFSSGLADIASAIQAVFQGIIDFITGIFTGNWEQAWQGVQDIFKGIFEALEGLIKTPINAVISIINKAISGINGLGLTIPDWIPLIGGKSFVIDIPQIPMLAKGGFTTGPSIAGEAGTEAVISFQRSARASNIATWAKAGQMLGVGNRPVKLESFDADDGGPGWPGGNGGGPVTITYSYSPTLIIKGNASREDVNAALREDKARFDAWYEEKKRNERRERW